MIRLSDRFVLEREIGSGGMSHVFLGRDEVLGRPVAVKILKTEYGGTDIGARFQREGRTAARLSHPNIVQVYDAGEGEFEGEEASFIVMEYIPGGDLKVLIDEWGTLSGGRLSVVGAEVAAGLAHAHERGVIHRDIKPHNVLLEEGGRARLTDFGIARALDASQATRTGSYLGTALYSPPEQLRGEEVTPRSDVYSLGATLYQAATGEPPFAGTPIEIASQHVHKVPTAPREINPSVSGAMDDLILACMSKDPGARPSADEARISLLEAGRGAHATRAYTEAPTEEPAPRRTPRRTAPPASAPVGPRESSRKRRPGALLAILAVVVVLAAIGALAVSTLLGDGEQRADEGGQQGAQVGGQSNDAPSGSGSNGGGQGPSDAQTATQSATSSASSQSQSAGSGSDTPGDPAEEAEQTVENHYEVAASEDYRDAWDFLSSSYQQEIGSKGRWVNQFQTLESVEFTSGPTTQVEGTTATVSFSTVAVHTDRVDRPSLTATLIKEGGEWKIDGLG